jgi:hypothetical protein
VRCSSKAKCSFSERLPVYVWAGTPDYTDSGYRGFSSVPPDKYSDGRSIRPKGIPSTPFPSHYSLFDATWS